MAKTTYIPHYSSHISITKDGKTVSINDSVREVSLGYEDEKVVFTVLHEEVTKSKVKSIKRAKSLAGLTYFMGGVAMGFSRSDGQLLMNYDITKEAVAESQLDIEKKKSLSIELLIENNSDETIFISDLSNGQHSWYIPANSYITVNLSNPYFAQFRVSNVYVFDPAPLVNQQETSYVSIQTDSFLTKENVDEEDENYWMYYKYITTSNGETVLGGCTCIDKETMQTIEMSRGEYNVYKHKMKYKDK